MKQKDELTGPTAKIAIRSTSEKNKQKLLAYLAKQEKKDK